VGWLDWLFVFLSWIGTYGAVFLVAAGLLALLWRRPWLLVLVLASDFAAQLLSYGMRDWIGRRRPPLVYPEPRPLVHVPHSGSFPSGHATVAFACAAVLAWRAPQLAFPAFLFAGAIAWSRVYVGVHWPLDVLGGGALGLLIATALLTLVEVRPRSRPETRAG
jgi:undecaprenyl-diphosphatase